MYRDSSVFGQAGHRVAGTNRIEYPAGKRIDDTSHFARRGRCGLGRLGRRRGHRRSRLANDDRNQIAGHPNFGAENVFKTDLPDQILSGHGYQFTRQLQSEDKPARWLGQGAQLILPVVVHEIDGKLIALIRVRQPVPVKINRVGGRELAVPSGRQE